MAKIRKDLTTAVYIDGKPYFAGDTIPRGAKVAGWVTDSGRDLGRKNTTRDSGPDGDNDEDLVEDIEEDSDDAEVVDSDDDSGQAAAEAPTDGDEEADGEEDPDAEEDTDDEESAEPGAKASKEDLIAWAATQGVPEDEAEKLTKDQIRQKVAEKRESENRW